MSDVFIGQIKMFGGNFAPRDYAFCDGSLVQIAQNPALFSILGTTYGGDGRTTFGLPNLQDRAPMHAGRGPGLTPRLLGQSGGSPTATVSQAQLGSHTHGWQAVNTTATSQSPEGNALSNTAYSTSGRTRTPVGAQAYGAASNLVSLGDLENAGNGATPSHYNLQPRQAVSYIIALTGTFPSRA